MRQAFFSHTWPHRKSGFCIFWSNSGVALHRPTFTPSFSLQVNHISLCCTDLISGFGQPPRSFRTFFFQLNALTFRTPSNLWMYISCSFSAFFLNLSLSLCFEIMAMQSKCIKEGVSKPKVINLWQLASNTIIKLKGHRKCCCCKNLSYAKCSRLLSKIKYTVYDSNVIISNVNTYK